MVQFGQLVCVLLATFALQQDCQERLLHQLRWSKAGRSTVGLLHHRSLLQLGDKQRECLLQPVVVL